MRCLLILLLSLAAAPGFADVAAARMARARSLFDAGDYREAGLLFYQLVEHPDNDATKKQAEFWLGRTLYEQGLSISAVRFLDSAVRGHGGTYHLPAVKWLIALAEKLPDPSHVQQLIASYQTDLLAAPLLSRERDAIAYHLARHHHRQGSFKKAVSLLAAVDPKGEIYPRARLLEGIINVQLLKPRPAATAFKAAIKAAVAPPASPEKQRLEELAVINLARLFYSAGKYRLAVKYYSYIPATSAQHGNALLERASAQFRLGQHRRALEDLRAGRLVPTANDVESYNLEAFIYHENCLYSRSQDVARHFEARFKPVHQALVTLAGQGAASSPDAGWLYDRVLQLVAKAPKGETARVIRIVLNDQRLRKSIAQVAEFDRELQRFSSAPPSWKMHPLGGDVLDYLTLARALAINDTDRLTQVHLELLARDLAAQLEQARKLAQAAGAQLKKGNPPAGCNKL